MQRILYFSTILLIISCSIFSLTISSKLNPTTIILNNKSEVTIEDHIEQFDIKEMFVDQPWPIPNIKLTKDINEVTIKPWYWFGGEDVKLVITRNQYDYIMPFRWTMQSNESVNKLFSLN